MMSAVGDQAMVIGDGENEKSIRGQVKKEIEKKSKLKNIATRGVIHFSQTHT